jgi:hypothetical protein
MSNLNLAHDIALEICATFVEIPQDRFLELVTIIERELDLYIDSTLEHGNFD